MKVADLLEPVRLGFIEERADSERAVHYVTAHGTASPLCGHECYLQSWYGHEENAPEWVCTDDVCADCRGVARQLLRHWHPRAKLPEWAR